MTDEEKLKKHILDLMYQLNESEKRLEFLDGSERTLELFKNAHLHHDLRKYTKEINKGFNTFFCTKCGQQFDNAKHRMIHIIEEHYEKN